MGLSEFNPSLDLLQTHAAGTNRNFDPALPPIRGYKEVSKHDGDLRLSQPYPGRILLYFTTYPKASHLQDMLDCWPVILDKSLLLSKSDIFVYMAGAAAGNHELLANWTGALEALSLHSKRNTTLHVADNPGYQKGAMKAMDELMLVDSFFQIHFSFTLTSESSKLVSFTLASSKL